MLDFLIGVTPRPKLLPAVNTILLAYGAFGGMIGTIGSTVWYEWGGEAGIASICAIANIGVSCIVVLLWVAHKQHPYLPTEPEQQKEKQIMHSPLRAVSMKQKLFVSPPIQKSAYDSVGVVVVADASLKIVNEAGNASTKLLCEIDENEKLLHHDNDMNDASKF